MTYNSRRIALVGVKHAGKSSVGNALASLVDLPFIDGDTQSITSARSHHCVAERIQTVRELYRVLGAELFHDIEQQSLKTLPPQYVYAAGGGIAECLDAWTLLGDACIVLLDVSLDIAWKRICASATIEDSLPAFLQNSEDPFQYFSTLYKMRRTVYIAQAHIVCNADTKSPQDIAEDISTAIRI